MASRTTTRARRPPARKPAARKPRRHRKSLHPYRWAMFGPALVSGPLAWQELGEPLHRAGWVTFFVLGILLVPPLMLTLLTGPGTLVKAAVPKDWRRRWRKHDWRTWFRRPMKHPGPPGALLQRTIRAADRNKCVFCGATAAEVKAQAQLAAVAAGRKNLFQSTLQLDHCFPWILGGLRSFWNFFLLCPACNMAKSCYWKYRESGNEVYSRHASPAHIVRARAILAAERRLQLNPFLLLLRCWRAAWAL